MGKRREEMYKVSMDVATYGLHQAMHNEYKEIENKTFHRLKQRYLKAHEQLKKYIENHSPEKS